MDEAVGSYVGAVVDYDTDKVMIWERTGAVRTVKAFDAPRYFYVKDPEGSFTSIYGDKLKKLVFDTADEYNKALKLYPEKFESDIPPLFKVLMNEYYNVPVPNVHFALLDIETDYTSSLGFSAPMNPYAPINAVTIYQSWSEKYLTYVVPPPLWSGKLPTLKQQKDLGFSFEMITVVCKTEAELLKHLVDEIQGADIISGWNSEFFDLPYIIKRLERVQPKLVHKMSFVGCRPPKEKMVEKFGAEQLVYQLNGRTHLDYLDLFKKFTFEGRTSYSLANIANDELDIPKLEHEGTLEQLYKGSYFPPTNGMTLEEASSIENDLERLNMIRAILKEQLELNNSEELNLAYKKADEEARSMSFCWFVLYNARDVEALVKLDDKFNFIQLVNQMAHENGCLFGDMLGTVRYVETGIALRAHNVHNKIVEDKKMMTDGEKVEGALVLSPLVGLHKWLGSVDIESLYPSIIRSLNMSPETFVGQFISGNSRKAVKFETAGEADWRGISNGDDLIHILKTDDGEVYEATGLEWQTILKDKKWAITAFGTVFDQGNGLGIVAEALTFWFAERRRLKKLKSEWGKKAESLRENTGFILPTE